MFRKFGYWYFVGAGGGFSHEPSIWSALVKLQLAFAMANRTGIPCVRTRAPRPALRAAAPAYAYIACLFCFLRCQPRTCCAAGAREPALHCCGGAASHVAVVIASCNSLNRRCSALSPNAGGSKDRRNVTALISRQNPRRQHRNTRRGRFGWCSFPRSGRGRRLGT